eukprot:scpid110793/ scgid16961/ 
MEHYPDFLQAEMEQSAQPPTCLRDLYAMFKDEHMQRELICLQDMFISEHCKKFTILTDALQSRNPCSLDAYDVLKRPLYNTQAYQLMPPEESQEFVTGDHLSDGDDDELCALCASAYQKAGEKMSKYLTT